MQRHDSKRSVTSGTSSSRAAGEKKILPTHMIIQNDNDNKIVLLPVTHLVNSSVTRIKVNNTATFKNDLNNRKQERGRIIHLGNKEECMEQLQIFEMTAELDEQNSAIDENDEINENSEEETNKTTSKKQMKISPYIYEHMNNNLNRGLSINLIKQVSNVVKPKGNLKSKCLQIDEEVNKSSSSEDDSFTITSKGSFRGKIPSKIPVRTTTAIPSKESSKISVAKKLSSEHEGDEIQGVSESQIIVGPQSRNIKGNHVPDMMMLKNSNTEEHQQNVNDDDLMRTYEALSKKHDELTKDHLKLKSEHDRLLKQNQIYKKTTMPIPDAAGRRAIIDMGRYLAHQAPDMNIAQYATELNVNPTDLAGCIESTTSSTARQVVKLLYTPDELLTKVGTSIPETQREAIRKFAESQKGPVGDHQFNEAVNGVFRAAKAEFRKQMKEASSKSASRDSLNKTENMNKGQKSLRPYINKKKGSQSNHALVDKENNFVEENYQDNE